MMTVLLTTGFVIFLTLIVPVLVAWLIWRAIRRAMRNAGMPAGAFDPAKLRELIAQARAQQGQGFAESAVSAPHAAVASPSAAPRAPQVPVVLVKSVGHGIGILAITFSVIGAVSAVVAGTMAWSQAQFLTDVVRVEGEVVRNAYSGGNKGSYHPVVRFTPEGSDEPVELEGSIGSSPPQFDVGERVTVLHPPGRPQEAKLDNWVQLWFGPMLSGFFALVFGGIGVGFLIPFLIQRRRAAWAREQGAQSRARFAHAEIDRTTRVNGRSPYKVFADWRNPLDSKTYRFQSHAALWFDPTPQLSQRPDIPLRVDPQQPNRYWLDLSHLQKP